MESARTLSRVQTSRKALRLLTWNAVLWTVGSSLAMWPVLLYFHFSERVAEVRIGSIVFLVAAVFALSRLSTPLWIRLFKGERRVAVIFSAAAAIMLAALPAAVFLASNDSLLAMRIAAGLFLSYVALDAIGNAAIWTWIGRAAPPAVRGRYLGVREMWRLLALTPTLVVMGWVSLRWRSQQRMAIEKFLELSPVVVVGGSLLLLAALLLLFASQRRYAKQIAHGWLEPWLTMFRNPAFIRLLLVAVWTSYFTAISIPAEYYLQRFTLDMGSATIFSLFAATTLGQAIFSRLVGAACDRIGNKPVMFASQVIAALVPMCLLFAAFAPRLVMGLTAVLAVAQVGVYLALNNLALKIAPASDRSRYLATFLAASALAFAGGVFSGVALDVIFSFQNFRIAAWSFNPDQYIFYISGSTRLMGLVFIASLIEPSATAWWQTVRSRWRMPGTVADPALAQAAARHPLD